VTGFASLPAVSIHDELAVLGGPSVRAGRPWLRWPEHDEATRRALLGALDDGRWTLSWPGRTRPSLEREFAERFAAYHGAGYGVSVDHGSSALVVALEALDIGPGDEVIVPAETWVATASAVLRVGAVPVLADVDQDTGCLRPDTVVRAMSGATRAVVVVHLACTVADVEALAAVARQAGVALVEDCAQAHGARWAGRRVGTFGELGAFSFQAGKALAGGEGGAVITNDRTLYQRLQELRADSRRYAEGIPGPGAMELVEVGSVMGANYGMSEFHAALLIDQLERLDGQHARREERAQVLEAALAELEGFGPIPLPACAERSIYEYGVHFAPGSFGGAPIEAVADAVSAELERPVYPPDVPLTRNRLFRPWTKRRFAEVWAARRRGAQADDACPGAEAYRDSTLLIHHSALLGADRDAIDVARAIEKVQAHAERLARAGG
jgi:L-glutamine:2-deoxy-scyllo-inosose/3-amino-2,3-dideoxy-scyllo-inosose aminotransferase